MRIPGLKSSGQTLRKAWTYTTRNAIWRVYPGDHQYLVAEERDSREKKTSFVCLDRRTGRQIWGGKRFVDDWWVGIDAVAGGRLFLHGFAAPDMPLHRGITAIDLAKGNELWNIPDWCFKGLSEGKIVAFQGAEGSGTLRLFDPGTGRPVGIARDVDVQTASTSPDVSVSFPEPVSSADELSPPSAGHCRKAGAVGPAEYFELPDYVILGYCVSSRSEGRVRQIVSIIERADGREIFSETVAKDAPGFAPDSFLVQEGMLYVVSEQRSIIAVNLHNRKDNNEPG